MRSILIVDDNLAILKLRFGLDGANEMTLEEVGKKFCVTRERVRQLQNTALSKMRKAMARNENQRSIGEIENEERRRKHMEVIREFIEAASARKPSLRKMPS